MSFLKLVLQHAFGITGCKAFVRYKYMGFDLKFFLRLLGIKIICFFLSFIGEGYIDVKDAEWSHDTELIPVDLNKLSARNFVVYKFGCFITRLVANHCQHLPVTLLIAEKVKIADHTIYLRITFCFYNFMQ